MKTIEQMKMNVELLQVQAAKGALELRIAMAMEEIERLKEHVAISQAKEEEIKQKLKGE